MDGVLADWGKQWDHVLNTFWPESQAPRHAQQTTFNLKDGLDAYDRDVVDLAMAHPHFYRDLDPIEGAVEALHQMQEDGHTVTVCTSPWLANKTCVTDKLHWLERHLGPGWAAQAVITKDKTIVHGDYLIDDKPNITGLQQPTWQHILYDQPYNQHVTDRPRILAWPDWHTQAFGEQT